MFGFGSSSSSSSSPSSSSTPVPDSIEARKQGVIQAIQHETALTNVQELMNSSTERCYKACVTNPGTSLTPNEQKCLSGCFDKYLEAFTIVSRAYGTRIRSELAQNVDMKGYLSFKPPPASGFGAPRNPPNTPLPHCTTCT